METDEYNQLIQEMSCDIEQCHKEINERTTACSKLTTSILLIDKEYHKVIYQIIKQLVFIYYCL